MAIVTERRAIRADGPEKVTGSGRYAADLTMTGMLHAKLRYAGVASGRITRLDTARARAIPGVFAVLTQADVPDVRYGPFVKDRTLFAHDVVRYEGEIVAAVAALTPEIAQAAADAIELEIEPLPYVGDVEAAMEDGAPLVHEEWAAYGADEDVERDRNVASFSSIERGDVDAAMAAADEVVRTRLVADASHAVPIEPRAIVAQWQGEKLTVWSSTQVPFDTRSGIAETLELPESRVRVIVPHLGGGFGGKCGFHQEAHVAALARKAGRPVRLLFSRREEFLVPDRRREEMVFELETGVMRDGTMVARRGKVVIDNGAYTADAAFFPQLAAMHVAGPYRIPNVAITSHLVYTHRQPSGSVRAPTAPQACWALEQHIDEVARAVGLDGLELRRRNVLGTGDEGPSGQVYDVIGARDCLEQAAALAEYGKELPEDEAIGIAIGWWPSFPAASGAYVKLNADGSGVIVTGAQECGTGAVMALRQLAADELGMAPEDFTLLYQDTDAGPYDMGATGSQTTFNNGRAVLIAADEVALQLRRMTAEELEAAPEDIELVDGHARVVGSPGRQVAIADLAARAQEGELLLGRGSGAPGDAPGLRGSTCIGDLGMAAWVAPQFSSHAVHVRLDRDTGVARVLAVSAAHDSGTILNPLGAEGQVEGGVLMGIGQALSEGTRYDDEGHQRNAMLLEYKLQTIMDAPPIRIAWVQNAAQDGGPHGAKGLAEAPNVTTAAAIGNALAQIVGRHVPQLPMTPERVWEAMAR
jgi:CO/xanthine dehydrogenase Mo-binding subunit